MRYILLTLTLLLTVSVADAQGRPGHRGRGGPRSGAHVSLLTDDQRTEVHALTDSLLAAGATREEVRDAVNDLFADWGIERPERTDGPFAQLTDDQRTELRTLIDSMREADATREEVRDAVTALFASWGIAAPDGRHRGRHRRGEGGRIGSAHNSPNPFNPTTNITYALEEAAVVSLQIYDMRGRVVQMYEPRYQSVGTHSVVWTGKLANGSPAPSGIYLYRIVAGDQSLVQRMVLLK